jgi:hypothetical protein
MAFKDGKRSKATALAMTGQPPKMLSITATAALLSMDQRTFRKLCNKAGVTGRRMGNTVLIDQADVPKVVAAMPVVPISMLMPGVQS